MVQISILQSEHLHALTCSIFEGAPLSLEGDSRINGSARNRQGCVTYFRFKTKKFTKRQQLWGTIDLYIQYSKGWDILSQWSAVGQCWAIF